MILKYLAMAAILFSKIRPKFFSGKTFILKQTKPLTLFSVWNSNFYYMVICVRKRLKVCIVHKVKFRLRQVVYGWRNQCIRAGQDSVL